MKPEGVARVTAGMTCPGGNCPAEPQQGAGLVDENRRGFLRGTVAASVAGARREAEYKYKRSPPIFAPGVAGADDPGKPLPFDLRPLRRLPP